MTGVDELAALWKRAPEIARRELFAAMTEADLLLQNAVQVKTPEGWSKNLRQSILAQQPEVSGDAVLGIVGTPVPYAIPVELGTKPHFPPVLALIDWVVDKLGVPEKEAKGVAFLVARKISRTGTQAAHMFRDGFAENTSRVQAIFERARDRIRNQLAASGNTGNAGGAA